MLKIRFGRERLTLNRRVSFQELTQSIQRTFLQLSSNFFIFLQKTNGERIKLKSENYHRNLDLEIQNHLKLTVEDEEEPILLDPHDNSDQEFLVIEDVMQKHPAQKQFQRSYTQSINRIVSESLDRLVPDITKTIQQNLLSKLCPDQKKPQQKIIHFGVSCVNCQIKPIVGIRYQCVSCDQYNLCEKCEAKTIHKHPFLKIRYPGQAPKVIIVCLEEQNTSKIQSYQFNRVNFSKENSNDTLKEIQPSKKYDEINKKDADVLICSKTIENLLLSQIVLILTRYRSRFPFESIDQISSSCFNRR